MFVDADAPAIRAFEAMTRGGVAFCAAVDERAGEIVANVSASDARGVLPNRIAALSLPLGDYLARAIDSRPGGNHHHAVVARGVRVAQLRRLA